MLPIIDTHQHLWDLNKISMAWTAGSQKLNRSYVTADYLEATQGLNVVKAIYMEVDALPSLKVAEADYVLDLCGRGDNPTCAAVLSAFPAKEGFRDFIDRFRENPRVKGVRQVLHAPENPPGLCLEPAFVEDVRYLGESGLLFDLCLRPAELGDAAGLVDQCPATRFILDHCGNADPNMVNGRDPQPGNGDDTYLHSRGQWMRDMEELGKRENLACKISGIVARARSGWTAADLAPTVDHCLDCFGPDRVVFGGDWPVCTLGASYREWVTALLEIIADRSEEERRKLLHDNAVRIYGLNPG